MNKNNVKISKSLVVPSKPGLYIRIVCMTGENKGLSYYLIGKRVVMGRGKDVEIQVLDSKSSREHAEIVQVGSDYILTDLESQNGIVVNELKVKQHKLKNNDRIVVGKTVFKFSVSEVKPELVVVDEDEYEDEEDEEDSSESEKPKKKNKTILYLIVVIGLIFIFLDSDDSVKGKAKKRSVSPLADITQDFVSEYNKKTTEKDRKIHKKLKTILHRGLREFRERNYFRAIHEFELALMLSPGNARAAFYLDKTRQAMDGEIEKNFLKAKRDISSLKYSGAVVSYCAILKLLEGYPDDERYKSAFENIRFTEKKMELEKGEITCK